MADIPIDTNPNPEVKKQIETDESDKINEPKVPDVSALFSVMNIDSNSITDVGPHQTIDVIPDMRYIVIQLATEAAKVYEMISQNNIPTVTPATIIASWLQTIYAYGAATDILKVREYTSYYGGQFLKNDLRSQYLDRLMFNTVPPIIKEILRGLEFTFDPRRKNLAYMFSFAAFDFNSDYGRIYPISMFITLHNLIANATANDTTASIWLQWLQSPVITQEDGEETIYVQQIIGAAYDQHTTDNFVTQRLKCLLCPLTPAFTRRRAVFTPIPTQPIEVPDINDTNPYIYLLNATNMNLPSMEAFTNTFQHNDKQLYTNSEPLFNRFGIESGSLIMNHMYMHYNLPTYHNIKFKQVTSTTNVTSQNFSKRLRYKCPRDSEIANPHKLTVHEPNTDFLQSLYLVDPNPPPKPDLDKVYQNVSNELAQPVILYSPWSTGVSSLYFALTNGLLIESDEIDGFHVPQPQIATSIHDENSHFLESAVPIRRTVNRTHLNGEHHLHIRTRAQLNLREQAISCSLYDMSQHRLPLYPATVAHEVNSNYLPGFTVRSGLNDPKTTYNKVCYSTDYTTKPRDMKKLIPHEFFLWSSYRWIDRTYAQTESFIDHTYALANFRTIYGTSPLTVAAPQLYTLID